MSLGAQGPAGVSRELRQCAEAVRAGRDLDVLEAGLGQQVFQTGACVAKEVKGGLVFLPSEWCGQAQLAFRLQQAVKFTQGLCRLRNVLEHLRAQHRVKAVGRQGNRFGRGNHVEVLTPAMRRLGMIDGDVIDMREELAKRRGARPHVGNPGALRQARGDGGDELEDRTSLEWRLFDEGLQLLRVALGGL